MPELPEVETVRRGLEALVVGASIARVEQRRPDLRIALPPRFPRRLAGRTVTAVDRRAKYLLLHLDDGEVLVVHLGMSGSLRVEEGAHATGLGELYRGAGKDARHDHVVVHFADGRRLTYNDPRRFGLMDLVRAEDLATSRHFAHLGREPLADDFDAAALTEAFSGTRVALKAALLDQRRIAGIGNIYACEALWRARLSPDRKAATLVTRRGLPSARARRLVAAVRAVLAEAVEVGGSSLRDHVGADGELGAFQNRFAVYDREDEPCPRRSCRGIVHRTVQAGRSTFFCPVCQR